MKKIIAMLIALCMMLSLSVAVFADGEESDMPEAVAEHLANIEIPDEYSMMYASSGSEGGTWYTLAIAYGEALKKDWNIILQCEPGGGGSGNYLDCSETAYAIGFTNNKSFSDGMTGNPDAEWTGGSPRENVRILWPQYGSLLCWYSLDPDIKTIHDLDGKTVNLGPASGGQADLAKLIFDFFDITPKEIIYGAFADTTDALKDGTLDVACLGAGHPMSATTELSASETVYFVQFDEEEVEAFCEAYPFYSKDYIPGGMYRDMPEDYLSINFYNTTICNADMPDDVAYALTASFWNNYDELKASVALFPDEADYGQLARAYGPFHPGAIKFYEDMGVLDQMPAQYTAEDFGLEG